MYNQDMNAKRITQVLVVLAVLALMTCPLAASDDRHTVRKPEQKGASLGTIYAIVALAGICVVAFKNTHRTHLD